MTLAGVELICIVFVVIFLVGQLVDTEKTKTIMYVKILCIFTISWLVIDSLALFLEGPNTPHWILWGLNFLDFIMRPAFILGISIFINSFIVERGKCSKWWFTAPAILFLIGIFFSCIYFILGHAGGVENGDFSFQKRVPKVTLFFYLGFVLYAAIVSLSLHKKIGLRPGVIVTISFLPLFVSIFILYFLDIDLTLVSASVFVALVCGALQRKNIQKKVLGQLSEENNENILALEDNFELLYDVNLNTFTYDSFAKGQSDSENIKKVLKNENNFFTDSLENAKHFVHPEDSQKFIEVTRLQYIRDYLETNEHIDYYYRLMVDGEPKWKKIRMVYKNKEKNHLIVGSFDAEPDIKKKEERDSIRKQLYESMLKDSVLVLIDIEKDTRKTVRDESVVKDIVNDKDSYSKSINKYIDNFVIERDRKRLREMTSLEYIKKRLKNAPGYNFKYREISKGAQRIYEMRFAKFSENEVLMSATEKDVEILTNSVLNKLKAEYFAIFVIDVEEGFVRILKDDLGQIGYGVGEFVPAAELFKTIANHFEEDSLERKYFSAYCDVEHLKRKFSSRDRSSYPFRLDGKNNSQWASTKEIVLSRKATDHSPAYVAFSFSTMDKEASDNAILQKKLAEDMELIGSLADDYKALFYINIDNDELKVRTIDPEFETMAKTQIKEGLTGLKMMEAYVTSPLIHPDDKHLFENFGPDFFRVRLKKVKKSIIRFRMRNLDSYIWYEIRILKNEPINEEANIVIMTIEECAEEIKKEQLLQRCFDIVNGDFSSNKRIRKLLALLGEHYGARRTCLVDISAIKNTASITYEWDADGVEEASHEHAEFSLDEFSSWLDRLSSKKSVLISEDDNNEKAYPIIGIFKRGGFKQVVLSPIMNSGELVGFVGLDVPHSKIKEMISARTVANIIYSEVLKHKESDEEHVTLNKVTSSFATVYYVDLVRDYAHNWKLDKEYRYSDDVQVISKFSESFRGYIEYCIDPSDKERCLEQTSKEYILEQFKTKSIFSINMKDISHGNTVILAFDFIKVSDDGNQFVVCSRDITEILQKENEQKQKLQEALELADSANKAKTSFLFNMSHDIRTPMNAILGFTNMAIKNVDDKAKLVDCLSKTQQSGNMLISLINNVLEVSRIESGHAKVEEKPADLIRSFANFDHTMKELAKSKNIDLVIEQGKFENRYVYCDIVRCLRIFVNITSNAIKYTPNGGKVTVRAEQCTFGDPDCNMYRCTVTDNGIGMSEEFQKHIFEQFTRESNTTMSGVEGTGLGMTVVKSFVDLLDGKITFTSKKGVGTTFIVELPFKVQKGTKDYYDPVTQQIICDDKENAEADQKYDFKGKKVLLTEDNMLNAEITSEILEDEGFVVEHATDGKVAVEFLKEKGPDYYDLILMDIQMPLMDGYSATKAIREMYPDANIPIIALSANAFQEDKDKSIAAGMNDHVAKPIDIKQLLAVVSKYL